MSKTGFQAINQQNNMALWIEQIEDCRSSGQTVIEWCAAHGIAYAAEKVHNARGLHAQPRPAYSKATYYTRQRKVYKTTAKNTGVFVEVQLDPQVETKGLVATVIV